MRVECLFWIASLQVLSPSLQLTLLLSCHSISSLLMCFPVKDCLAVCCISFLPWAHWISWIQLDFFILLVHTLIFFAISCHWSSFFGLCCLWLSGERCWWGSGECVSECHLGLCCGSISTSYHTVIPVRLSQQTFWLYADVKVEDSYRLPILYFALWILILSCGVAIW